MPLKGGPNDLDHAAQVYTGIAREYADRWYGDPVTEPLLRRFIAEVSQEDAILDAGCGPGHDVEFFLRHHYEALGIDLSPGMLTEARRRMPAGVFRQMDIRQLQYPPSTFGGVWSCASLQHLSPTDLIIAMRAFARVLKPGGVICVTAEFGSGRYRDTRGLLNYKYTVDDFVEALDHQVEILYRAVVPHLEGRNDDPGKTWLQLLVRPSDSTPSRETGSECLLCPSERFRLNREAGLRGPSAILWGDEYVYVTPDVAPLVDGHLLIVTTEHYLAASTATAGVQASLRRAQQLVARTFMKGYGTAALFFEHGACVLRTAGGCIDHAHIHALPLSVPLDVWVQSVAGAGVRGTYEDAGRLLGAGQPYLFVETIGASENRIVVPVDIAPSQILRLGVTVFTRDPVWRWQTLRLQERARQRFMSSLDRLLPIADNLLTAGGGSVRDT